MSLWSRFLDWLLGREIMSIEDLKIIEGTAVHSLERMFENVNAKIDTDDDGMVSVREAWTLIKGTFSTVKAVIKEVFR